MSFDLHVAFAEAYAAREHAKQKVAAKEHAEAADSIFTRVAEFFGWVDEARDAAPLSKREVCPQDTLGGPILKVGCSVLTKIR
jgi:hypothetical protein